MSHRLCRECVLVTVLLGLLVCEGVAQEQWKWPEKPKNLQVLPNDWPGSRLSPVMKGFTRALGVRCSYCHKGEEGKDLLTYDFVSDENPNKTRAREMLRMLGDINDHLKKITPSGGKPVNMWCHTCHHGRPRPMTLGDELGEKYRLGGISAAVAHYQTLRKQFSNKGAYDFSERSLNEFGYELLEKDARAAVEIFALNTREYPESANTWDSLGEAYLKSGDPKNASACYEKCLQLDPENENAKTVLKKIREESHR